MAPDGRSVLTGGSGGNLRLWDLVSMECVETLKNPDGHTVECLAFTPNGRQMLAGDSRAMLTVWNWSRKQYRVGLQAKEVEGSSEYIWAIEATPDSRFAVLVRSQVFMTATGNHSLQVWDLDKGIRVSTIKKANWCVSLTPDGRFAVTGGEDHTVKVWDLASGACARTLEGHTDDVEAVTVFPDGQYLAAGCADGTIRVWNLTTNRCEMILCGHIGSIRHIAVILEGRYLVSGGDDRTLRVWALATRRGVATFPTGGEVSALAASRDLVVYGNSFGEIYFLQLLGLTSSGET